MEEGISKQSEFIYWVNERENVRRAKEAGLPKPWSTDPVFQETYFCNVNRENDKVTRGIRELWNVWVGMDDHIMSSIVPNMMMARFVNKVDTLRALAWPYGDYFSTDLWSAAMSQKGAWGGAYIVSTNGRAMPKHEYIGELLKQQFEQPLAISNGTTCQQAHKALMGIQGLGSFMSAQIVADIKNTPNSPLEHAPDWWRFSAHGPGSLRGLSWFHGRKVTPRTYTASIYDAYQEVKPVWSSCMQDLQNCFCEFDKYMRVKTGTGKSKRKYNGQVN